MSKHNDRGKDLKEKESVGYVTLDSDDGGLDYRTIADIMTIDGKIMGHSTVRNVIMKTMEKFAASLMAANGIVEDPAILARGPMFQKIIASYIQEIYSLGVLEELKEKSRCTSKRFQTQRR